MSRSDDKVQSVIISLLNGLGYDDSDWEIEKKMKIVHLNKEKILLFDFLLSIHSKPILAIEIKKNKTNDNNFLIQKVIEISDYIEMLNLRYLMFVDMNKITLIDLKTKEIVKEILISGGEINDQTVDELNIIKKENFLKLPEDFTKIIWELSEIIRSNGLRYEEIPFELVKILYLKIIEDKHDKQINYNRFNELIDSNPNRIKKDVLKLINNLKKENENLFSFDDIDISNDTLINLIKYLAPLNLINAGPRVLNEFIFHYFLKNKHLGNYTTPPTLIKFLVELANPKIDSKIIDLTAGTGSILIEIKNYIKRNINFDNEDFNRIISKNLIGIENNELVSNLTKLNFYINDLDPSKILIQDSLTKLTSIDNNVFDIVIFDPPFGKIDLEKKEKYSYLEYQNIIGENADLEALFVLKGLKILKKNGILITILPESFYYSHKLNKFRQYLKDSHQISAIISLPSSFFNYTSIKSSILVLIKGDELNYSKNYNIFMGIIENIESNQKFKEILNEYKKFREDS